MLGHRPNIRHRIMLRIKDDRSHKQYQVIALQWYSLYFAVPIKSTLCFSMIISCHRLLYFLYSYSTHYICNLNLQKFVSPYYDEISNLLCCLPKQFSNLSLYLSKQSNQNMKTLYFTLKIFVISLILHWFVSHSLKYVFISHFNFPISIIS